MQSRTSLPPLDEQDIQKVVDAIGCEKNRARTLLYLNNGDADKAIALYMPPPVDDTSSWTPAPTSPSSKAEEEFVIPRKPIPEGNMPGENSGEAHPSDDVNSGPSNHSEMKPPEIEIFGPSESTPDLPNIDPILNLPGSWKEGPTMSGGLPIPPNSQSDAHDTVSGGTPKGEATLLPGQLAPVSDSSGIKLSPAGIIPNGALTPPNDGNSDFPMLPTGDKPPTPPSSNNASTPEGSATPRLKTVLPDDPEDMPAVLGDVLKNDLTKNGHQSPILKVNGKVAQKELLEPEPEWNFVLPTVPAPNNLKPGGVTKMGGFSLRDLIGAMQHGAGLNNIDDYIRWYDAKTVAKNINGIEHRVPAIFYAVGTNDERIIRAWVNYGGDVNAVYGPTNIPLLAFAVINSDNLQMETTSAVTTLLSLGADPTVIPQAFYRPFDRDLPDQGPDPDDMKDLKDRNKRWITPTIAARLARTLNLSQRYYLEKAVKTARPSSRQKQVAIRRKAEAVLGIHYFLIGQTGASRSLMQKLLSYMILPSKRPLVLVFAGPSGHGKTELARRLGQLLSLELQVVDCTIYNKEADLFGHRTPYTGAEKGTPLNNFLSRKAGTQSIVFLDEFEKTTSDVHKALLIPFDNGEYQDRRSHDIVDCSKTLWILATNALDPIIKNFCQIHKKIVLDDPYSPDAPRLLKTLQADLKNGFKDWFGPPLTGRVTAFVPFVPFNIGEQAIVAHKYVLELAHKVRKKISLSFGPEEQLLGNVYLRVRRDGTVCKLIANEGYDEDLGARSLIATVKSVVEDAVVEAYLEVDEEITEEQKMTEFVVDITGHMEVVVNMVNHEPGDELGQKEKFEDESDGNKEDYED